MTVLDSASQRSAEVTFVFPPSRGDISGGHLYNERLCDAMSRACALRTVQVDDLPRLLESGAEGVFILDSLDLFVFSPDAYRAAGRSFAIIAHYLGSMGRNGSDAGALLEQERRALEQFDLWITTGAYATDYLTRFGSAPERIVEVLPAPPHYGAIVHPPPPPLRALVVANVLEQKGIRELLQDLNECVRETDAFSLEIVGRLDVEPEYAAECQQLALSPLLAGRVHFRGVVPPERVVDHYQRANLCVSASKMETFGMALQEARAAGLPLLVFDGGNAKQHVIDGAGMVVSSMSELAFRLVELARAPEQLHAMATRAQHRRDSMTLYDWDSAARTLLIALIPERTPQS